MKARSQYRTKLGWAEWSQIIDESLPWYTRVELTGLTIKKERDGWFMRVSGLSKGKPVVCFISGKTYHDCWVLLGARIQRGHMQWRDDKYPPYMGGLTRKLK